MAKNIPTKAAPAPAKATPTPAPVESSIKSTVSRNSPLPKTPGKREISHEMIAKRAYEIYLSGKGGSQDENWSRAERELRSM